MANLNIIGPVICEIDHTVAATATRISVSGDRPSNVKFGGLGAIGTAVGFEKVSASLTFAIPATGLEFDILGALERPGGFAFSFPIGAEKHMLIGCRRSKRGFNSTPGDGEAEFTLDITATDWVRIR